MALDSPGWLSVVETTIAKYFRKDEVNILRSRVLLAMMEQKSRVTFNHSGTKFDRKIRYRRGGMTPYADGDVLTFARVDRHKSSQLPNDRGYVSTESMGHIDTLQNKGNEAIVNLWNTKVTDMSEDIRENFCDELYKDGYAALNVKRIMGIESCLGAAAVALYPGYVQPSDTYGDLSTVPGTYGGAVTDGTYPRSTNSPEYDFWSPILVDYTSPVNGAYSAADRIWKNTCVEAIRNLLTSTRRQKSREGMVDLLMLEETLFLEYKNHLEQFKQIPVVSGDGLAMRALGFEVLSQDGSTISTEYGMPFGVGYAFNTNKMELKSLEPQLFNSIGPIFNEETRSYRWAMSMTGNLELNPRFMGKLADYHQAAA